MLFSIRADRLGESSPKEKCKINLHLKGFGEFRISPNSTVYERKQIKGKQILYSLCSLFFLVFPS